MGYREADTFTPPTRHAARARQIGNQTLPSGVITVLSQGDEIADTDGYYDGVVDDRFTIPTGLAGLYLLTLNTDISRAAGAGALHGAHWLFGGGFFGDHQVSAPGGAGGVSRLSCGTIRSFVAADFIQPRGVAVGLGEPGGTVQPGGSPGGGNDGLPSYMTIVKLDT